jgi:prepilin-type processing-associated H-X9-DG protein
MHNRRVNVLFGDNHVKGYEDFSASEMTYSLTLPGITYTDYQP